MRELKPRTPKQYAPVKFGESLNPQSVEGVQMRRRQAAAIRARKEEEAETAEIDAHQAAEETRLAARSPILKLWDRIFN
jgi:hypothetical protein